MREDIAIVIGWWVAAHSRQESMRSSAAKQLSHNDQKERSQMKIRVFPLKLGEAASGEAKRRKGGS
jgi:hypothetical protein